MSFDLQKLEEHLNSRSYVEGYTPSQADVHVFEKLGSAPDATKYPHAARWYTHIKSYAAEHGSLPGSSTAGEAFTSGAAAAAPAAADDDDEVDLFGDDEEEDAEAEKLKAERVAAYNEKKAGKPKAAAKSVVTLQVKPWDDTTDMAELEKNVRALEMDGLVWGLSTLKDVAFGLKMLQITLVIEDDKVSLEDLQAKLEEDEDHVQSTDVAAMQKL